MQTRLLTLALLSFLATTSHAAWATEAVDVNAAPASSSTQNQSTADSATFSLSRHKIGDRIASDEIPAMRNIANAGDVMRYMGDEYGVSAVFLTNGDTARILYITPDGQGILPGPLFGGDGSSVTLQQVSRLKNEGGFDPTSFLERNKNISQNSLARSNSATQAPVQQRPEAVITNPDSPGEKLFREANAASWIAFGPSTAPMITVFMDPGCDHCHKFFRQLKPLADKGVIYLRVLPVTQVNPTERATLINVFSSPSPAKAWDMITQGLTPPLVGTLDARANNAVTNNNNIMIRWKLNSTPYSIYRNKEGTVKVLISSPDDMNTLLDDMGVRQ